MLSHFILYLAGTVATSYHDFVFWETLNIARLYAVFPAVQFVRLRGRKGRTTARSPSFWEF